MESKVDRPVKILVLAKSSTGGPVSLFTISLALFKLIFSTSNTTVLAEGILIPVLRKCVAVVRHPIRIKSLSEHL